MGNVTSCSSRARGARRTRAAPTAALCLRSSLREFVCSEAMHALGVPTTRALALVATGEPVMRDMFYDGNPELEPGAITSRVAPSFLRFGNFELPAIRGDHALLRALVEFTLAEHFPALAPATPGSIAAFFAEVARRTAVMVAHWMRVGFVHGVMNTDNMSILGLTIDYGPYGWLEPFDLTWTPNTTDAHGRRYCFGAQPRVAMWNLLQLARALLPLGVDEQALTAGLTVYEETFSQAHQHATLQKLGLAPAGDAMPGELRVLLEQLPTVLGSAELDMTLFFRRLADVPTDDGASVDARLAPLAEAMYAPLAGPAQQLVGDWLRAHAALVRGQGLPDALRRAMMDAVNPLYVPRNYLAQEAIDDAARGDVARLHRWTEILRRPYQAQPGAEAFAARRPEWARDRAGCSMLSCSS
jgi:uncharacterized protein YdiU (UPF0061 family)